LAEYLFQQGEISKGTFRVGSHLKILDDSGVQGFEADLLDHHSLHEAMDGAETVYNLASPMPDTDARDYEKVNTEGISNLLEVAKETGVKTIIHLSTLDVYGFKTRAITESSSPQPTHPYQKAKLGAEKLVLDFAEMNRGVRVVIIRAARAIGPRDRTIVLPILKMAEGGKVLLPAGGMMSFTHPKDIAQAMYRAATAQVSPRRLCLLKSFDSTLEGVAMALVKSTGREAEIRREGFIGGRSLLPDYASQQSKASLIIGEQEFWRELGYAPSFDVTKFGEDVGEWYRRQPWVTEE